jgi:hypothetical protein
MPLFTGLIPMLYRGGKSVRMPAYKLLEKLQNAGFGLWL